MQIITLIKGSQLAVIDFSSLGREERGTIWGPLLAHSCVHRVVEIISRNEKKQHKELNKIIIEVWILQIERLKSLFKLCKIPDRRVQACMTNLVCVKEAHSITQSSEDGTGGAVQRHFPLCHPWPGVSASTCWEETRLSDSNYIPHSLCTHVHTHRHTHSYK